MKKITAFGDTVNVKSKNADNRNTDERNPDDMNIYAAVDHNDDNSDMPVLTADATSQDLLDYMVLVVCRRLQTFKTFKGGYLLNQLLGEQSRMTSDIDYSISDEEGYEQVKVVLKDIADVFMKNAL